MTKKLVKELREAALGGPGEVTLDMLTGAADEIERLQKHNDELLRLSEQRAYRTAKPAMANTLVQRLEALATALEEHSPEDAQTIREAIIALAMPSHEPGAAQWREALENADALVEIGKDLDARLLSGDAIACISMALQNPPDTQEWARLLGDCRYVIEKLEGELLAAKHSRNDEQRLRRAAEKSRSGP